MEKVTLKLKTPVKYLDEEVTTITLRPLLAKDLRDLPVTGEMRMGHMLDLAAKISDQPPSFLERLSPSDAMEVVGVVSSFLAPSEVEKHS